MFVTFTPFGELCRTSDIVRHVSSWGEQMERKGEPGILDDSYNVSNCYRMQSEQDAMAWMKYLGEKLPATYQHCIRVAILAEKLAVCLAMNDEEKGKLVTGCFLHDVGKALLPIELWNQMEALSEEQWRLVHLHPTIGAELIKANSALSPDILQTIRHHHERWDGTGYPNSLKGEEIPYFARICSVADAFDSVLAEHTYVKLESIEEAKQELLRESGSKFDNQIVQAFLRLNNDMLDIYMRA
jgi:putative nucleotidyltransferase with HDIG domain